MELSSTTTDYGFCIAAKNTASLISLAHRPEDVLRFVDAVVRQENRTIFASRQELCSIFSVKLQSLVKARRVKEATKFGEEIMAWDQATPELVVRVATSLLSIYSLHEGGSERALQIARQFSQRALHEHFENDEIRMQLLNNIAFVFAEHGEIGEAEQHLQAISAYIHKSPYPTATSGLLHFRKGHSERADQLYSEALHLCMNSNDKARIRQKWNLEVGKTLIASDPKKALRTLTKARDESDGEEWIASQAATLLKGLPHQ